MFNCSGRPDWVLRDLNRHARDYPGDVTEGEFRVAAALLKQIHDAQLPPLSMDVHSVSLTLGGGNDILFHVQGRVEG